MIPSMVTKTFVVPGAVAIGAALAVVTLMRLRELEVIEKIAANGELKVVLGDKGLADRVLNVL